MHGGSRTMRDDERMPRGAGRRDDESSIPVIGREGLPLIVLRRDAGAHADEQTPLLEPLHRRRVHPQLAQVVSANEAAVDRSAPDP